MTTPTDYVEQNKEQFLEDLKTLVRIPSISTLAEHKADVQYAAGWVQQQMQNAGLDAEIILLPEGRHPLVLGTWAGAGPDAPTVLLYTHYDVQPAVIADGWTSAPFEPVEREGYLYGRGAVDSKLHVVALIKAIEALLATEPPPVNIKLVIEGEEESGSENINALAQQQPDKLKADAGVIADGTILSPDQPSLVYALRGLITLDVIVTGPKSDLHSGHFGGNTHNPIQALTEMLAQLHDADGRITVPGFYDNVQELDAEERGILKAVLPWVEADWERVAGAPSTWGESDYTLHERAGARPTLEINGIAGGFYGEGFKTVLPHKAIAKISCRLVPHQDPNRITQLVSNFLQEIAPPTVNVNVSETEFGAPAVLLDRQGDAMQSASAAYAQGWGKEPIFERAGGSVPITYAVRKLCPEVVIMGYGYKSGRAHGPDENIHIESLYKGIYATIHFLQDYGQRKRKG